MKITNLKTNLKLLILFSAILLTKSSLAAPPTSYGRIYNVQDYIDVSSSDIEGINRCFTEVAQRLWDTHSGNLSNITIIFPVKTYSIDNPIRPQTNGFYFNRQFSIGYFDQPVQINILGLTVSSSTIKNDLNNISSTIVFNTIPITPTSWTGFLSNYYNSNGYLLDPIYNTDHALIKTYLDNHLVSINMQCNQNPSSHNYLSFNANATMPIIESHNSLQHIFFDFKNVAHFDSNYVDSSYFCNVKPSQIANTEINIMGIKMIGIDGPHTPINIPGHPNAYSANSHIYDTNNYQQNNQPFSCGTGINIWNFPIVSIDNNIISNIYGDGISVFNNLAGFSIAYKNGPIEVSNNAILNCWSLQYNGTQATFDYRGDGILFAGIKGGISNYNYIVNDLDETKQYGRVALATCSEHNMSTIAKYNVCKGYDRGIHIENCLSDFDIEYNRVVGSETGIVFDGNHHYGANRFPDYCPNAPCPEIKPSYIRYNYVSNEEFPYNPLIQKIYPPCLFWALGLHSSNEYTGSEIENNTFVLDKENIHDYPPNPLRVPWIDSDPRYHIKSGIRKQKIKCNLFLTKNPLLKPNRLAGGTKLSSYCTNDGITDPCSNSFNPPIADCIPDTNNEMLWSNLPIIIEDNAYIDCAELYFLHGASSAPTMNNNYIINNPPMSPISVIGTWSNTLEYTKNLNTPNCAQELDNTFCNGKPYTGPGIKWNNISISTPITYSNLELVIIGTLAINSQVTFNDCIFHMLSGSKITVVNNGELTLNACNLSASCYEMWDGILADNDQASISIKNSCLRDMQFGVQIKNGANLNCAQNTFADNYTSIMFENTPGGYVNNQNTGNRGIVLKNTFTSTGINLLPPYSTLTKSQIGILVKNCGELEIGELITNSKNSFKNLLCGIDIIPMKNASGIVRLLNNDYINIKNDYSSYSPFQDEAIINNTYTNFAGAGVFIENNSPMSTVNPIVHVESHGMSIGTGRFQDCDKAIAGANVSANVINTLMLNCKMGIALNDLAGENIFIERNQMQNVFKGVQLIGDIYQGAIVGNTFDSQIQGISTNAGQPLWPCGIDIQYTNNYHKALINCDNNLLNINSQAGIGISNALTGIYLYNTNNTINFTTNISETSNQNFLIGINSFLTLGNTQSCNVVNGLTNANAYNTRPTVALNTYESTYNQIDCNSMTNTWAGMMTLGDSYTNDDMVKGNLMGNHNYGMLFMPSLSLPEGNFGNLGDASNDNNNRFVGLINNPGGYQYYRHNLQGASQFQYFIYSNNSITSGYNNIGSPYNPQFTNGIDYNCNVSHCNSDNEEEFIHQVINNTEALNIINENVNFNAYTQVSQYFAERRLFADLDQDIVSRASNPTLNSFYLLKQQEPLGKLFQTEKSINSLTDSIAINDTIIYEQRRLDAISNNQSVNATEDHEINEKWVNEILLKIASNGRESLTIVEIQELETLAKSCPLVAGFGVYKARTIYTYYEPALSYNDFELCNSSNKNGSGLYDGIINFFNSTQESPYTNSNEALRIKVYPNPASSFTTFEFDHKMNSQKELSIFDMEGRLIKTMLADINEATISLNCSNFISGVYTYKIKVSNQTYVGKLIIAK